MSNIADAMAEFSQITMDGQHFVVASPSGAIRIHRNTPAGRALAGVRDAATKLVWDEALAAHPTEAQSGPIQPDPPARKEGLFGRIFGRKQTAEPPPQRVRAFTAETSSFIPGVPNYAAVANAAGLPRDLALQSLAISETGINLGYTNRETKTLALGSPIARSIALMLEEFDAAGITYLPAMTALATATGVPLVRRPRDQDAPSIETGAPIADFTPSPEAQPATAPVEDQPVHEGSHEAGSGFAEELEPEAWMNATPINPPSEAPQQGTPNSSDRLSQVLGGLDALEAGATPAASPTKEVAAPAPQPAATPPSTPAPDAPERDEAPQQDRPEERASSSAEGSTSQLNLFDAASSSAASEKPASAASDSPGEGAVESDASQASAGQIRKLETAPTASPSAEGPDARNELSQPLRLARRRKGPGTRVTVTARAGERPRTGPDSPSLGEFSLSKEDHEVMSWLARAGRDTRYKIEVEPSADGETTPRAKVSSAHIKNSSGIFTHIDWAQCVRHFETACQTVVTAPVADAMKSAAVESAVATSLLPGTQTKAGPNMGDVEKTQAATPALQLNGRPFPLLRPLPVPKAPAPVLGGPTA